MLDPVDSELFRNRFTALATEMGEMLRRMAISTNVKERLDFSCALLDHRGRLVVNAPHIPVHLGAMGICVRSVAAGLDLEPGDVIVTNHPGWGGSHLPDVTVIEPVFAPMEDCLTADDGAATKSVLLGYVANRSHHAELGGIRPGSMPPDARCLAQEGVVIAPRYLARHDIADWEGMAEHLRAGPYPSRSVDENLADLRAAVAANRRGATTLRKLATQHGWQTVRAHMAGLRENSGEQMERALRTLGSLRRRAVQRLDDGAPLVVEVSIADGQAAFDFTGSSPVHSGNLNATPAIVTGAVLYVLRMLLDRPLPLNEGLLDPVRIVLPEGMLNPPFPTDPELAPAVVGGNVETSQRLVDTLLLALGLVACSQGTMNNFLFGNQRFGYYETICGGAGAGPGFEGASAVHTHMTNTRITDPEILELRYPVRLERFEIRSGSGGSGRFRGGDGAIRELLFEQPAAASFLTQHRVEAPYGCEGGGPGALGRQRIVRASGAVEELPPIASADLQPGDRVLIETPGGGGWGESTDP